MIRWPRSWFGWKRLFWLSLYRCPIHHKPLVADWPLYDDGVTSYAFCCEGIGIWPGGLLNALRGNARASGEKAGEGK